MRSRVRFAWSRSAVIASCHPAIGDRSLRGWRQQEIEQPFFRRVPRLVLDLLGPLGANHVDGELDQVADHRLHVAADVADFGELRGLDLDERRLRQLGETAGDLGLADSGRPDHQDVLRRHFVGDLRRQPLTAHAVPQRNGHGALGLGLSDDVLVELGDDLARRQRAEGGGGAFGRKIAMSNQPRRHGENTKIRRSGNHHHGRMMLRDFVPFVAQSSSIVRLGLV